MTKLAEKADMHTTREREDGEAERQAKKTLKATFKVGWAHKPCASFYQRKKEKGGKKEKSEGRKLFEIQSEEKNSKSKFGDFRSVSTF